MTALDKASYEGHNKLVELLLKAGSANPSIRVQVTGSPCIIICMPIATDTGVYTTIDAVW